MNSHEHTWICSRSTPNKATIKNRSTRWKFRARDTDWKSVSPLSLFCADRVPVELSYDAYLNWYLSIWGSICHLNQNICQFSGPSVSAISSKNLSRKILVTETYTNWCDATRWIFFFRIRARWRSRIFYFFFEYSSIRVKVKFTWAHFLA